MAKYKGKTIEKWMDLEDNKKLYEVGSIYETDDKKRFDEILGNNSYNKAFIETLVDKAADYEALTVDEIKEELNNREIDYDSKLKKAELIEVLRDSDSE